MVYLKPVKKLHLLIIRFSSLGDIILSTSVVSAIKARWGDKVEITYLTSSMFVSMLEGHRDIDRVLCFSRVGGVKGLIQLLKEFWSYQKKYQFDFLLDLHGTLRSLAIRIFTPKLKRLALDKRTLERWLLTGGKFDLLSTQGPFKREGSYGELLLERNPRDFGLFFGEDFERSTLSEFIVPGKNEGQLSSCAWTYRDLENFDFSKWSVSLEKKKYICLIPSASYPEKRWSETSFYELIELLIADEVFKEINFVLLAGPDDKFCRLYDKLVEKYPGRFYNLQGKTSLPESTMFLKHSLFCIGNDTGLPHISESVGTPAAFILGPTGEEFGFYPHLKSSKMISRKLWCRPCTTNGKGTCIRSERFCLTGIKPQDVLEEVKPLVRGVAS